jgi:hypothetical protein
MRKRRIVFFLGLAVVLTGGGLWGSDARSPVSRSDHPDQTFLAVITPLWRDKAFDKADAANKAGMEAHRRGEIDIRAADLLADIFRAIHREAEDFRNGVARRPRLRGTFIHRAVLTLHNFLPEGRTKPAPAFDDVLRAVETLRLVSWGEPHFTYKGTGRCTCNDCIHEISKYRTSPESKRVAERLNGIPVYEAEFLAEVSPAPHAVVSWKVARWICAMAGWPQPPLLPRANLSGMPADRPVFVPAPEERIGDKLRYTSKDLVYSEDQPLTIQCLSHGSGRDFLFIHRPNGDSLLFVLERGAIQRMGEMVPYKMTSPGYLAPFLDAVARESWPKEGESSMGTWYVSGTGFRFRRMDAGASENAFEERSVGLDEDVANRPGTRWNEPAFMGHRLANFAAHLSMLADMLREAPTAFSTPLDN